jgi:hypothetical protein
MRESVRPREAASGSAHASNHASTTAAAPALDGVGDDVREQRQLIPPALDVLIARDGFGHFVCQVQPRGRADRLELDGDPRPARRNQLAAGVSIGERDPSGSAHFDHFAGGLGAAGVDDFHFAAGPGVDLRPGAPPRRPARRFGEEREDHGWCGLNDDRAIDLVCQRHHDFLSFVFFRRRRGLGPRRVCSNSATSFNFHSASSHIRSSMALTGPSASRRA